MESDSWDFFPFCGRRRVRLQLVASGWSVGRLYAAFASRFDKQISIAAKRQENYVKRFMINVVLVAVGLGVSLASRTSEAAEHDLRVGSFEGNWCGYECRFDITERIGNKWEFKGMILIKKTGEYDKIQVKQYADNHLMILRTVKVKGTSQRVDTHPPKTVTENGKSHVNFRVAKGDVNNLGHLNMPVKP
jgi:hypothetical protein